MPPKEEPFKAPKVSLTLNVDQLERDVGRLRDFDQNLEPEEPMGDQDHKIENSQIDAYIEQRLAKKLGEVKNELNGMIDNF